MTRKIELYGVGFNPNGTDTNIEVKLDGEIVYTGNITTDTTQNVTGLNSETVSESVIASWTESDVAATHNLSIRAISGDLLYTASASSYIGETAVDEPLSVHSYTNADGSESISDPNANVLLDNEPLENGRPDTRTELFGQWNIAIPEGSTMTCDFIVDAGEEMPSETTDTTV